MNPEELPGAPRFNRRDAFALLEEARNEPNTAQWVLARSLISRAEGWFMDMAGKRASLSMTKEQVGGYIQGFLLPLLGLQAARLSLNEGKENYLRTAGEWEQNPGLIFAMQNLDSLIQLLNADPSGKLLMQEMATTGARGLPDPYFVRGLRYAEKVYGEYMDFFFNYGDEVDLW